ncbi:anti-RNA polymerase sigma 70 factor [Alcanivorax sp. S71-1-4]|uniref:Rsd/AlgQ family anti-sigma factor n=1 Tax=Alcanivorax sp. S71-1-4 TaxID=1177159 RepID=UPI00135CB63B|nr:Rsd/AlgQ family anti-sigma factor [Alcanivorax sp. S71-1-4]KAF0807853.1 anti-RNA polymerase sigma 70 factor [Alcanivorax sp. S71-1-4]
MARPSPATPPLPQWQRTETLVQTWLKERQQLLALLCALPDMNDANIENNPALHAHIQSLCQTLMDYISAGYFEIYRELAVEARSLKRDNPGWLREMLQRLEDSTDAALAFNEHVDQATRRQCTLTALPEKLASLLEKLEERFVLEDQLIISFHLQGNEASGCPPVTH